jgi:hypothetical protein
MELWPGSGGRRVEPEPTEGKKGGRREKGGCKSCTEGGRMVVLWGVEERDKRQEAERQRGREREKM